MNKNLVFDVTKLNQENIDYVKNILKKYALDYYIPLLTPNIIYVEVKSSKTSSLINELTDYDLNISEQGVFELMNK